MFFSNNVFLFAGSLAPRNSTLGREPNCVQLVLPQYNNRQITLKLNVLAGNRIGSECDIPQYRTTCILSPMPHSLLPLPFDLWAALSCCHGLDHLQNIFNLGDERITKVDLDPVGLTVHAPKVLQALADILTMLGESSGIRAPEETQQTVLDALMRSLLDNLQLRCEHFRLLIRLHLFTDIGPVTLELFNALLCSPYRQRYLLHLLIAELLAKRRLLSKCCLVDEEALQFVDTALHFLGALLQQAFLDGHNDVLQLLCCLDELVQQLILEAQPRPLR